MVYEKPFFLCGDSRLEYVPSNVVCDDSVGGKALLVVACHCTRLGSLLIISLIGLSGSDLNTAAIIELEYCSLICDREF